MAPKKKPSGQDKKVIGPSDDLGQYARRWIRNRQANHPIFRSAESRIAFENAIGQNVQMPAHTPEYIFHFALLCEAFGFEEYIVNMGDIFSPELPNRTLVNGQRGPKCNCDGGEGAKDPCSYCHMTIPAFLFR
jgi:hypothetical protein